MATTKHKKHTIVATLRRIELFSKGVPGKPKATKHTLSVSLPWLRTTISGRTWPRVVEMDGMERDYAAGDWCDAILFKETIQAPAAMELSLTPPMTDAALAKLFAAIGKASLGILGDMVEKSIEGKIAKLAGVSFDQVGTLLAAAAPDPIGEGRLQLDDDLLDNGGVRTIELVAKHDILRTQSAASGRATKRVPLVRKGEKTAEITIEFECVE